MNYRSGIAGLPKELISKLIKIPSFQEIFLSKAPWSEDSLDTLFKDTRKQLRPTEQEQFYHALLKDITFATYDEWRPKIHQLQQLAKQHGDISSRELSDYANKAFSTNSREHKEVQKLTRDIENIIIILCNTHSAFDSIKRKPSKELRQAVDNIFSLADNANVFNTMITIYNDCEKILQSYNKPSPGKKKGFGP